MATQAVPRKQTWPSLLWIRDAGPDEVTLLSDGVVIGRDPAACDVVLDADVASRRHARIMTDPGGDTILADLGSSNGTFVNGEPVTRILLADGDRLGFGSRDEVHCLFRAPAPTPGGVTAVPVSDASESPTEALPGELGRCPICLRLVTPGRGTCNYCSAMPTRSRLDETVVPNAEGCAACGAAARSLGAFCHRCGARLPGR